MTTEITVTLIIRQDENNIWFLKISSPFGLRGKQTTSHQYTPSQHTQTRQTTYLIQFQHNHNVNTTIQ